MRFGEFLVQNNRLKQGDLSQILESQKRLGGKLGEWIVDSGLMTESVVYRWLAEFWKLPYLSLAQIEGKRIGRIPKDLKLIPWRQYHAIYLGSILIQAKRRVVIVTSDPHNFDLTNKIQFISNERVLLIIASQSEIREFHENNPFQKVTNRAAGGR